LAAGLTEEIDPRSLRHPIYDPVRGFALSLVSIEEHSRFARLDELAARNDLRTANGLPLRFAPPRSDHGTAYEQQIFDTGVVPTRPGNRHDFFNALAWLAFPRTKAAMNRMHAQAMRQGARESSAGRGPLRDMLTLLDEGGAIVRCSGEIEQLIREHRWRELFWDRREALVADFRISVLGHAVLDKALHPWPGITCKVILVQDDHDDPDAAACRWLEDLGPETGPRLLRPLPVFGLPGWLPDTGLPAFYDDERWFRPLRRPEPATRSRPLR
jgi:hypothetical protein